MRSVALPIAWLICLAAPVFAIDDYVLGPDSMPQEVPHGTVTKFTWDQSKVFPNTTRSW